ncbi:hypothetical protein Baya_12159 [Bagarius yarrelli]|uniref:Uncharacterized protein n=1 Tax=Bagarius yarrelli TaxID=175774 RepID=A0A556V292_BAGYA|nr:hypothetical protein Baya_12159 [Bagarius yarrelli]
MSEVEDEDEGCMRRWRSVNECTYSSLQSIVWSQRTLQPADDRAGFFSKMYISCTLSPVGSMTLCRLEEGDESRTTLEPGISSEMTIKCKRRFSEFVIQLPEKENLTQRKIRSTLWGEELKCVSDDINQTERQTEKSAPSIIHSFNAVFPIVCHVSTFAIFVS